MYTTQQCILMNLLDCGFCDLELLEDINYDLDEILEDLVDNNCLSLNDIFREVFIKGAYDLKECYEEKVDEIREEIIELLKKEKEDFIDSGEMTEEELEETEEHQELIHDLYLIDSGKLNPVNDLGYYCDCSGTCVSMKHIDFYRRYMENDVDWIEDKMGWSFK